MPIQEENRFLHQLCEKSINTDEEIVIAGISGRFAAANNMKQFCDSLMNKIDLVSNDGCRWKLDNAEIPKRQGRVNNITKFDADFFGISGEQANSMDPSYRMILEHAYEAIVDAGINPNTLRGTKTGVYVATGFGESEMELVYLQKGLSRKGLAISGCSRSMSANRISSWLGVTGPSYAVDAGCTSSLIAMEQAYWAIKNGLCDAALVGGVNLCLHPKLTLQYFRWGALSQDGRCKAFDKSADGYVRSEAATVVYMTKLKDAKRNYATVVHVKINCDGFKEEGVSYPSATMRTELFKEFHDECKVSPSLVQYIEAHGPGTGVGDPIEITVIDNFYSPGRTKPLKIGSVKSNMGHTEAATSMTHIAKIVIANETGIIPPNLHYNTPADSYEGLQSGRLEIVTEPTGWSGGYVAISSYGFGGANGHMLLKSNPKEKINGALPCDDLPRLIVASGRTKEAVETILMEVESQPLDSEFIRLLHDIHAENIPGHCYRGYTIIDANRNIKSREIHHYSVTERPVWYVFSGLDLEWLRIGTTLLHIPVFVDTIERCDITLQPYGVNIHKIWKSTDHSTFENILNVFVGTIAVQIGLIDLLAFLGVTPDRVIGYSLSEISCAYADGCFTLEQAMLTAYYMTTTVSESNLIKSSADIERIIEFINCASDDHPANNIADIRAKLFGYLKNIISDAKLRRSKWLSVLIAQSNKYHTNNSLYPDVLEEICRSIPKNAIVVEIAPHGFIQSILKKSSNYQPINIVSNELHGSSVEVFLQGLGNLYKVGLQPAIWKLYPDVQFPVSRGTPMISPLVRWEHSQDWHVMTGTMQPKIAVGERIVTMSLSNEKYEYITGHLIDGRTFLPATAYLVLIWETLGMMIGEHFSEISVVFEDVKFLRATFISNDIEPRLSLMIQKGTGKFEVTEDGAMVVSGYIRRTFNPQEEQIDFSMANDAEIEEVSNRDIYKELRLRGYQYSKVFKSIMSATTSCLKGTIRWANNWAVFLDNMVQFHLLGADTRSLGVQIGLQKLVIDTKKHTCEILSKAKSEKDFKVYTHKRYNVVQSGGVQIRGLMISVIAQKTTVSQALLETHQFVAHKDRAKISLVEAIRLATQLCVENYQSIEMKVLEVVQVNEKPSFKELISSHLVQICDELPTVRANTAIVATENLLEEVPENINIIDPTKLAPDYNALILAGQNLITNEKDIRLNRLLSSVETNGFIITLEPLSLKDISSSLQENGLHIILEKIVEDSTFLLLRRNGKAPINTFIIQINNEEFSWLDKIKAKLKEVAASETPNSSRILLVSDKNFENGLLGFVNCLRKEPGGDVVRAILIQDSNAPDFSLSLPLYSAQFDQDLAISVLGRNNVWGSYRHEPFLLPQLRPVYHARVSQFTNGDLKSLQWVEGTIASDCKHPDLINVIYSSLNFKYALLVTGSHFTGILPLDREQTDSAFVWEYSGITKDGRRVMGLQSSCTITNLLISDPDLVWTIPNYWTFEQAATVPYAYATSCYALYICAEIKKGEKLLIHDGYSDIGQAAIVLAVWSECKIFVTVATVEQKRFIAENFPNICDKRIGFSENDSFAEIIMEQTNGKGVDIVLHTLTDNNLKLSVRSLAEGGRLLRTEKPDIAHDYLNTSAFSKQMSFYTVQLENIICGTRQRKIELNKVLQKGIDNRVIKPLSMIVFHREQLQIAFTHAVSEECVEKILLKIQNESGPRTSIEATPHYQCRKNCSYLIIGGLGGIGLELCDWLIFRSARNVILVSRVGVKTGYQRMRIKLWKSYGVNIIIISNKDISKEEDCKEILSIASEQGPIDGIYNLAMVLKDDFCINQTVENFEECFKPKAWCTKHLDKLSRSLCRQLRHFVVFSSAMCGRGNNEQTNYGMANSVMERICEQRVADRLPGLAIQWGIIGTMGYVAEIQSTSREPYLSGYSEQSPASSFHALDCFLNQKSPIVSSIVVASKKIVNLNSRSPVDAILNLMGLRDVESVGGYTTLAELGIDSMMTVEIKQILKHEFNIFLTLPDIRSLTFAKLIGISSKNHKGEKSQENEAVEKMKGSPMI